MLAFDDGEDLTAIDNLASHFQALDVKGAEGSKRRLTIEED
jgi:hypothetical protein